MPKQSNKIIAKIKELKKTTKGLAFWRLIKWSIFFFLLFVFCLIASNITPKNPPKSPKSPENIETPKMPEVKEFKDYQSYFTASFYDYQYEIKNSTNTYIFDGEVSDKENRGYKDKNGIITKYFFENNNVYQIVNNEKIIINDFYEDFDRELFNIEDIYTKIKGLNFNIDNNSLAEGDTFIYSDTINKYTITFFNKEYTINIITSNYEYTLNIKLRG